MVHLKENIEPVDDSSNIIEFACFDPMIAFLSRILLRLDFSCTTLGLLLNPFLPRMQANNNSK